MPCSSQGMKRWDLWVVESFPKTSPSVSKRPLFDIRDHALLRLLTEFNYSEWGEILRQRSWGNVPRAVISEKMARSPCLRSDLQTNRGRSGQSVFPLNSSEHRVTPSGMLHRRTFFWLQSSAAARALEQPLRVLGPFTDPFALWDIYRRLQSRVWFQMRSLDFSVDLILPAALWLCDRLSL
jgi:hypothetical protein